MKNTEAVRTAFSKMQRQVEEHGAGYKIEPRVSPDGNHITLIIPAINCVYIHMLGSDCHNILTSKEHISAFAEELKGFDYDLVLTSHYVPEGQDAVETKIAYLEKTLELADACADAASFIEAMNEAFPDYSGANYLETTAGMLYQ